MDLITAQVPRPKDLILLTSATCSTSPMHLALSHSSALVQAPPSQIPPTRAVVQCHLTCETALTPWVELDSLPGTSRPPVLSVSGA